jgi:cytochrome c
MRFLVVIFASITILLQLQSQSRAGPMADAALAGDLDQIRNLIAEGVAVDEPGVASPLYFAIQRGHSEAATLLIERGADVNKMSNWGTPLHIAARKGNVEVVRSLLARGADPSLKGGDDEWMPLHNAAVSGSIPIAELLLQHGADVNAPTRWLEPPIHIAVLKGRTEFADFLREKGASRPDVQPISSELAAADLEQGRLRAIECGQCHAFEPGETSEGPNLWNIVDRPKAGLADYPYSEALAEVGGSWDFEELNRYLAHTTRTIPGTSMDHGFERERHTRINLIAYLRTLSENPVPVPE